MPEELPYYVSGALAGIVPTPERVSGATLGQREKAVCKPLYELQYTRKYLTPAACSLQNRYILSLWRQARESRAEGGCLADCLQWEARVSDDRVRASFDETMKRFLGAEPDLLYWQQVPGFHAECPGYCSFFSQRIAPDGQAAHRLEAVSGRCEDPS